MFFPSKGLIVSSFLLKRCRVITTQHPGKTNLIYSNTTDFSSHIFAHAERLARIIVNKSAGLLTIETRGGDDEIGYVEGQETVAIKTTGIALGQHKSLADNALGINVTEIGTRKEPIVATRTQQEPARVGAPVVERLRII